LKSLVAFGARVRTFINANPALTLSGSIMATAVAAAAPLHEDSALLDESFGNGNLQEGSVIKGPSSASRRMCRHRCGLKTEAGCRCASSPGRAGERLKVGDTVEVYLERVENALGSGAVARQGAPRGSWGKLEKAFQATRR